VTKGAKCDGGVADVREVGEHHLQDREVVNHWGGDGGDEKEDCSGEEEECADMVEHSSLMSRHFACLLSKSR